MPPIPDSALLGALRGSFVNAEGQGCLHFRKNGGNKDKASRKRLESAQTGSGNLPRCLQGLNGAQRWRALGPGVGLLSGLGRLFSPRAGGNLQGCPPGPSPRLTSDLSAAQVPDSDEPFVPDFHAENCEWRALG